jgi:hypothetical protein
MRVHEPDDKATKVQRKHIKPVDSVNFEDGFLRDDDTDYDEDQSVCKVSKSLPKPEKYKTWY